MAKKKTPAPTPAPRASDSFRASWGLVAAGIVLVAYAVPLLSEKASIHWDAVDVHYSAQRYFADHVRRGEVPFWTPYLFSGFPFLADPQTGGWYPGNWPFLLVGAGPRAIEAELALHALLAVAGAFLLLRRWTGGGAAAAGALTYALGGFFAGHSSHIGVFESAALFPWLGWALLRAVEGSFFQAAFWGMLVGGSMILAGHFQTSLYVFAGTALLALAVVLGRENKGEGARRAMAFLGIVALGSLLLSAIQTLPGLELAGQSIRGAADYNATTDGVLEGRTLATLVMPDSLGAMSGEYRGPGDVTQYYFYAGILLLPLAANGLRNAPARLVALCLGLPALLYAAGPALGFFRMVSWLPGFRQVRAPVHAWFLVAFALAVLAAAGVEWLGARWKWAGMLCVAVLGVDLCINNFWSNPLAYAHESFEWLYGGRMEQTRGNVVPNLPPMTRFEAPDQLAALGPMNHPLDLRFEATYGYNPLQLRQYSEFREAMARNPRLRDSLSVSRGIDTKAGALVSYAGVLPRAYFPQEVLSVQTEGSALRALDTLDPPRQAVVVGAPPAVVPDGLASASLEARSEREYRVKYKSATANLLRLATPFYPGWKATVEGADCQVIRVDHAMMGVVVPAGEKELKLLFSSTYFGVGAALSGCGIVLLAALGAAGWRKGSEEK